MIGLCILLLLSILPTIIGCILGIYALDLEIKLLPLLTTSLSGFLLCLFYAGITLLLSLFTHSQTVSILISLAVFGFFFLFSYMIIPVVPALESIAVVSPFHYYDSASILIRNNYSCINPIILFLAFAVVVLVASWLFNRKDIIY
jgi:ABC-type transport system involved in multi-copper enzyme maturation permease subunit